MNYGSLKVFVYAESITTPITNALIKIKTDTYKTDEVGESAIILLPTVSKENSLTSKNVEVCAYYNITVSSLGFTDAQVSGIEIFEGVTTLQNVFLHPSEEHKNSEVNIDPIVLSDEYSPKYNEDAPSILAKVYTQVLIPEYIIVHDGVPDDYTASKYYVNFSEYIKNVASSEIYPTWEKEALKANVLAIISFTLNRVYSEWYLSNGYNFTITSSTSYDQKYTTGKTSFDTINEVVDEVLPMYIKRISKEEPLFSQYCDGETTKNEGWLYQWGSNSLAQNGYTYDKILKYYYGDNLEFKNALYTGGLPTSYPGYNLSLGDCGEMVKKIQEYINIIRGNYPGLIEITNPNGEFDENTEDSIIYFQKVFYLSVTGIVDFNTWYKISYLYVAITGMLNGVYDR